MKGKNITEKQKRELKAGQRKSPDKAYLLSHKDEDQHELMAKVRLNPVLNAADVVKGRHQGDDMVNVNYLMEEIENEAQRVHAGDMSRTETMLIAQAHTLDSLFAEMISRARSNMGGEYFHAAEKYMKLALKAQSQCRTTLEALAEIKNPKPYIQNNKAQYQQVNNGVSTQCAPAHAHGENLNQSNELLEDKTDEHQWMDAGTPEEAGRTNKELATLEPQHRPEN